MNLDTRNFDEKQIEALISYINRINMRGRFIIRDDENF